MYPALHRLEADGLLSSRWSTASGRRRREYKLTAAGRRALGARLAGWRAFARAGIETSLALVGFLVLGRWLGIRPAGNRAPPRVDR